jgi:DNA-binding NtrC family response regulator
MRPTLQEWERAPIATILVIDDDQIIVDLLKMVVEDAGHAAIIANGRDRIPHSLSPDLIITDLVPLKAYHEDDARQWIAELRGRFPRVPIVIVTAHGEAVQEADHLAADAVLGKPFDVDRLGTTLARLLPRR